MRDPIDFERTLPLRPSSPAWVATIKAAYGSELTPAELELFRSLSGGLEPPEGGTDELLAVVGRRGGKSETIARLAVFEAIHGGHEIALAPGQVAIIPIISPLREQGQQILNYATGIARLPQVAPLVDGEPTRDSIRFKSGIEIKIMTADAVNVSGPTVCLAVRDEYSKFPGPDSATPDFEIDNSLRPALAPVVGAPRRRLIGITSAYVQEGAAYTTDRDNFGKPDSGLLVVRGTSQQYNPALDGAWLEKERKRVGQRVFDREYLGVWQPAIFESWFGATAIENCRTARGILPPVLDIRYTAALDLGWRSDGSALAIVHREKRDGRIVTVVDGIWYWPANSTPPSAIVQRSARIIREYHAQAYADQHHFDTIKDSYAKAQVKLRESAWKATGGHSKTTLFNLVRLQMLDGSVEFPNDADLFREFYSLAGRLRQSGVEELAARGSSGDDRVHAVVLAISEALERQPDRAPVLTLEEKIERDRELREFAKIWGGIPAQLMSPEQLAQYQQEQEIAEIQAYVESGAPMPRIA